MIINTNMNALNANRMVGVNSTNASKAMAQLSSGLRINSAADDASGLAISEKMKGQINGLNTASSNAQTAVSLTQTADGALTETTSVLQRMRELAVQGSNDTNTTADRTAIQTETTALTAQIDNIANTTQFNTKNLLDGSIGNTAVIGTTNALTLKPVQVSDSELAADTYAVKGTNAATLGADVTTNTTGVAASDFTLTSGNVGGLELGNYTMNITAAAGGKFDIALQDKNGTTVASASSVDNTAADVLTSTTDASKKFTIASGATLSAGTMSFNLNATYATASDLSIKNSAGTTTYASAAALKITDSNFTAGGLQLDMTTDTALKTGTSDVTTSNNALTMQIGANSGQTMKIAVNNMTASALGVSALDLTTSTGSEAAITAIDAATASVSNTRSQIGAYQNRLQSTINNLGTTSQNLTAAQSAITDVDMAATMAEFSKDNVESQAAQAMISQANQQPAQVLQLLR